jgi:hypothetical protein
VVKVHSELHERQKLLPGKRGQSFWQERYEDINHFERHLTRNGTIILKFFLHISKNEQKKRSLERLEDPEKHWKFSASDLAERAFWKDYMDAFEDAPSATSTESMSTASLMSAHLSRWLTAPRHDHRRDQRLKVFTGFGAHDRTSGRQTEVYHNAPTRARQIYRWQPG